MNTLEFLQVLYGEDDLPGSLVLWTSDDKRSFWFSDIEKAAGMAGRLGKKHNCFLGMALQDPDKALEIKRRGRADAELTSTRGLETTVTAIPGLWMDIDVAGPNHAQSDLPGSVEEALELVNSFPLPPTVVVFTGGGIHAHWLFRELFVFEEPDERDAAKQILTRLQYTLQDRAKSRGWKLDSTYDLSRVLRPPGTFNHKGEPIEVTVLYIEESRRYAIEDFDGVCLEEVTVRRTESENRVDPSKVLVGIGEGSRDVELFRYASSLRARGMPREEAEILILQAARSCTPPFPDSDAIAKLESAWKYQAGSDRVKLAQEARESLAGIETLSAEEVFTAETVGALALIKETNEVEWSRIKAKLKGKVNLNDLTKVVNARVAANHNLKLATQDDDLPLLDKIMPDIPLKGLRKPGAWSMTENGIWQENEHGAVCACPEPVILTERIMRIEGGPEKWGLAWYDKGLGSWKKIVEKGSIIFSNMGLIQLIDAGLSVTSASARDLVRYLGDLQAVNLDTIPIKKATGRMGWVTKDTFIPGMQRDIILDPEDGMEDSMSAYSEMGTLENWMDLVRPLRELPMSRFILAAGFASPLLELLRERVFLVHLYGTSSGGKTAVIKAALSIWGDPDKTLSTFYTTKVALERTAALYCDLPLGIDEKQIVADQQGMVDALVYILGSGQSKGRGNKTGGLQRKTSWRSIVLTSGEDPLTSSNASTGLKNRSIETYETNTIPDVTYAKKLHQVLGRCHGTAGPVFINALYEAIKEDSEWIVEAQEELQRKFDAAIPEAVKNHSRYVADICIGDWLSSKWIWGLNDEDAEQQAYDLGIDILGRLETSVDIMQSVTSFNYLMSWYEENAECFEGNLSSTRPHFGFREGDTLYVLPNVFEAAMKKGGHHPGRILRDWAHEGRIRTYKEGTKVRYKIKKTSPVTHNKSTYVAVILTPELPIRENPDLF